MVFRLSPLTRLTRLTSPGWLLGMSMLIGNGMPAADATEGALCNCRGSTGQQVQAVDRDHAHTCNINGSKSTHDAVVRVVEKLMIKQGGTRVRHNKTEPRREDFFGASSSHRGPDIKATINGTVNIYDVTGIAQDAKPAASAFLRAGSMETTPINYRRAMIPQQVKRDGGNKEMVLLQTGRRSSFGSPVGGMPILYTSLKRPKWYRVADGKGYYIFLGGNSSSSLRLFPRKI